MTRYILLAISLHMDAAGKNAWPSQTTLARRALISRRSVVTHVEEAERQGWVRRYNAGRNRQGWRLNGYEAMVPDAVYEALPERPWETDPNWRRGERVAPPTVQRGEPRALRQVEKPLRGENGIDDVMQPAPQGGATGAKRGEPAAHKSSLSNAPYKSSQERERALTRTGLLKTFCKKEEPGKDQEAELKRADTIVDLLRKGFGSAEIPRLMHASGVTFEEVQRVETSLRREVATHG